MRHSASQLRMRLAPQCDLRLTQLIGDLHGDTSESNATDPQPGTEHLARQHHARLARHRYVENLHRWSIGNRADLESQRFLIRPLRTALRLWASTGTKDPTASDVLYVKALAAPFTVNTMPESTLKALANRKELGSILPADGGNCEEVLSRFAEAGINIDELAAQLQDEGAQTFVKSWNELMSVVDATGVMLEKAAV